MNETGRPRGGGHVVDPPSAPFFIFLVTFLGLLIATFPYSCYGLDCPPEEGCPSSACENVLGMIFGHTILAQVGSVLLAVAGGFALALAYQRLTDR